MSRIRVVVTMHAKPGEEADFAHAWQPHGAECRNEDGCLQYELYQSTMDPTSFALLELWADRDRYDRHWEAEVGRAMPHRVHTQERDVRIGRDGVEFHESQRLWELDEHRRWVPIPDERVTSPPAGPGG